MSGGFTLGQETRTKAVSVRLDKPLAFVEMAKPVVLRGGSVPSGGESFSHVALPTIEVLQLRSAMPVLEILTCCEALLTKSTLAVLRVMPGHMPKMQGLVKRTMPKTLPDKSSSTSSTSPITRPVFFPAGGCNFAPGGSHSARAEVSSRATTAV